MRVLLLFKIQRRNIVKAKDFWLALSAWTVIVCLVVGLGCMYYFSSSYDEKLKLVDSDAELAATQAFVQGACGGEASNCNLIIEATNDGDAAILQYRVIRGKLFHETAGFGSMEPVLLSRSCTGYKLDSYSLGTGTCRVEASQ